MPPTLVRPQTFTVFQQPDSASPAVRFLSEQNTYLIGVLQGCTNPLPCQLIPVCQLLGARALPEGRLVVCRKTTYRSHPLFCAVANSFASFDGPAFCPRCLRRAVASSHNQSIEVDWETSGAGMGGVFCQGLSTQT